LTQNKGKIRICDGIEGKNKSWILWKLGELKKIELHTQINSSPTLCITDKDCKETQLWCQFRHNSFNSS